MTIVLTGLKTLAADRPTTQSSSISPAPNPTRTDRRDRASRRNRGDRSSGRATTQESDPYALLQTRSIFVKGNQTIARDSGPGSGLSRGPFTGRPEAALVFNGVIVVGDEANALIEDTGSNDVRLVKAGDQISVGKVDAITFDDLAYESKGEVKHVQLGQNLRGETPPAPSSQPSGSAPVTDGAAAPGDGSATPPPAGGSSTDDILAKMRAKRNQELGIK